jgi:hypothetical protein
VLTPGAAAPASSSPAGTCQRRSPATTQAVVAAPGPPPRLPLALWNMSAKEQSAPDLLQPADHLQLGASCCTQPARHHGGQSDPPPQLPSAKPAGPRSAAAAGPARPCQAHRAAQIGSSTAASTPGRSLPEHHQAAHSSARPQHTTAGRQTLPERRRRRRRGLELPSPSAASAEGEKTY